MDYEYKNGLRDKNKIMEKAHRVAHKRIKEDNWLNWKSSRDNLRKVMKGKEYRKKMSLMRLGDKNPMWGKPSWHRMYPTKKWWDEPTFERLRKKCLERDGFKCVKCGENKKELYCDHIIPYRVCKEHKLENLQMLCGSCHSKKTMQEDVKKYPQLLNKGGKA